MPKEYLACVASEMKAGKKKSIAQKICAIAYYKKHGVTPQEAERRERRKTDMDEDMSKAVWTTAYINDLPDSSFAYIESGGKKDSDGKTTPRSLRHLPYKDKNGKVDAIHVRNALARLSQTQISAHAKARARAKLTSAARSVGVKTSEKTVESDDMLKFFAPFSKIAVEGDDCVVEGYMTTGSMDTQDEEVDLQASFDAVEDWKKWGNIREMHGASAAGVALEVEKQTGKGVYLDADIIDPVAKTKVRRGVYKGFSIGGKVLEREGRKITKYRMLEVSLVDRPANPDCLLMVAKADYDDYDADVSYTEATTGDVMEEEKKPAEEPTEKPAEEPAPKKEDTTPAEAPAVASGEAAEKSASSGSIAKAEYEKLKADHEKALTRITELEKSVNDFKTEEKIKEMVAKAILELKPDVKKQYEEMPKPDQTKMKDEALEAIKKMSIGEITARMLKEGENK